MFGVKKGSNGGKPPNSKVVPVIDMVLLVWYLGWERLWDFEETHTSAGQELQLAKDT